MKRRVGFNPKRKIAPPGQSLCGSPSYKGNPQHKLYPNDYNLSPPSDPRPGKTLCDATGVLSKTKANDLLNQGWIKEMVSTQRYDGWPQNIWAVDDDGRPFEAQLENRDQGHYHGYPMPMDDDFRNIVIEEWAKR